ncbi:hypothetical protein [Amycolatopsis sp. RTGN1]|uniref:hypothetical protein n=1 Tax=Amycolatopsis ponsaeliensis TaxID=2992142 RepID=UPI0025516E9D|nr:hypothetical protein [Amycolatopsis sp. RTGN1]
MKHNLDSLATLHELVRANRPPGHRDGPVVRDPRHVFYRPIFTTLTALAASQPPDSYEVFLGRHLLGNVVRFAWGDWGSYCAADGRGLPVQDTRAGAAGQLLHLARTTEHRCERTSTRISCPAVSDSIHRCYIAPLDRQHYCECVCGTYL